LYSPYSLSYLVFGESVLTILYSPYSLSYLVFGESVLTILYSPYSLSYLVFGESVLNDAVAIVLFRTFSSFLGEGSEPITAAAAAANFVVIFVGSTMIGWVSGCFSSLLFKHIDFSHNRPTEMIVFGLVMYLPFLLAEYFELSGIVAILFTGIACKHYTFRNLSERSGKSAEFMFFSMAFLTEAAVFVDLVSGIYS
jgi:NhaP-type Na+/H+ or K+/H+ antiporter